MGTATLNSEMEVLRMPESLWSSGIPSSAKVKISVVLFKLLHLGVFF